MSKRTYLAIEEITNLIGPEAARAFVERFGGQHLWLPRPERIGTRHRIASAIGLDPARCLAARWPRQEVEVPRGAAYRRAERDAAIRAELETASTGELAQKYGLTERQISRIRGQNGCAAVGTPRRAALVRPARAQVWAMRCLWFAFGMSAGAAIALVAIA